MRSSSDNKMTSNRHSYYVDWSKPDPELVSVPENAKFCYAEVVIKNPNKPRIYTKVKTTFIVRKDGVPLGELMIPDTQYRRNKVGSKPIIYMNIQDTNGKVCDDIILNKSDFDAYKKKCERTSRKRKRPESTMSQSDAKRQQTSSSRPDQVPSSDPQNPEVLLQATLLKNEKLKQLTNQLVEYNERVSITIKIIDLIDKHISMNSSPTSAPQPQPPIQESSSSMMSMSFSRSVSTPSYTQSPNSFFGHSGRIGQREMSQSQENRFTSYKK